MFTLHRLASLCLLLLVLVLPPVTVLAGDLEKGLTAYKAGKFEEAYKIWLPLGESGNADAQFNLGLLYRKGQGIDKNDRAALMWFIRAAKQGMADAQYNAGVMYMEGRGASVSRVDALKWWKLAVEKNHIGAQYNLGVMYAYGMATEKDVPYALSLWKQAAEAGHVEAKTTLYKTYSKGLFDQEVDIEEAKKWQ